MVKVEAALVQNLEGFFACQAHMLSVRRHKCPGAGTQYLCSRPRRFHPRACIQAAALAMISARSIIIVLVIVLVFGKKDKSMGGHALPTRNYLIVSEHHRLHAPKTKRIGFGA